MTPSTDIAPFRTVCNHLADLAVLCVRVIEAMQRGQVERVSELIHETRALRAELAKAQLRTKDLEVPRTAEGLALLRVMKCEAERVSLGDEAIRMWLARPRGSDAELLPTAEGRARILDATLPLVWDTHFDVVILVGTGGEALARDLVARKQRRIVVFLPEGAPFSRSPEGYPDEVVAAWSHQELKHQILSFAAPAAERAVAKRFEGGGFDFEEHKKIADTASEAVEESRVHITTIQTFGERWALQGLANLPDVAARPSIGSLDGLFAGKPMAIVSPGPSLLKNIELLKQMQGKVLIFSFCQTLRALRTAGVKPDIVLATDPQDLRYLFEGHPMEEVPALLLAATVHPTLFKLPAQRIFTVQANSSLDNWIYDLLGERMRVPSAGSVACTAFTMGIMWNCDPIILVGQDLAYTGGQVYVPTATDGGAKVKMSADGTHYETASWCDGALQMARENEFDLTKERRTIWLPGYYGGEVPTSFSYSLFHRFFRNVALDMQKERPHLRLWNCTEGGAYIEGMEHLPLAQAIARGAEEWTDLDVGARFDEAIARCDADARCQRLLDVLVTMRVALDRSVAQATRCLKTAEEAMGNARLFDRLDRDEARLHKCLKPVLFISLVRQQAIADAVDEGRKAKTAARNLDAAMRLYRVILDGGRILKEPLNQAIADLRHRFAEKQRAA